MKMNLLQKLFLVLILLFMLGTSFLVGYGMSPAQASGGEKDTAALCLAETTEDVYIPGTQAQRESEQAEQAEKNGCIVVLCPETAAPADTGKSLPAMAALHDAGTAYYVLPLSDAQQDKVYELCEQYDIPSDLAFGVISADSVAGEGGDEDCGHAVMRPNAQSMEWFAAALGISSSGSFADNVRCGVYMLSEYYHKYNDISKIAMCYQYGEPEAVRLWEDGVTESEYSRAVVRETATLTLRQH